jgi:hypothetical protein
MFVHLTVNLVANYLDLGDATAIASTLDTCLFGDAIPLPNHLGDAIPPHPPPLHHWLWRYSVCF